MLPLLEGGEAASFRPGDSAMLTVKYGQFDGMPSATFCRDGVTLVTLIDEPSKEAFCDAFRESPLAHVPQHVFDAPLFREALARGVAVALELLDDFEAMMCSPFCYAQHLAQWDTLDSYLVAIRPDYDVE